MLFRSLRDKLFSAIKIPQSYLARGEGSEEDKTTLAQKDIRFARTVQRLQRAVISELEKMGTIHLYVLGYRSEDLVKFKLKLNNPSKIAELQELETWKTKFDVASGATEGYFSKRWIAKKIFNMTDEEFLRNQREMFYDAKLAAALEKTATEPEGGADAGVAGMDTGAAGGGGGGGMDMGTGGGGAAPDLSSMVPGDEGAAAAGGEAAAEPAAPETGDLLASPGKRDDRTPTPRSKGKVYIPVKSDKRDIGARARSYASKWGQQNTGRSERSRLGSGAQELFGLGNGIYEEWENNYKKEILTESTSELNLQNIEEIKILQNTNEIRKLINSLETRDATKKNKDEA